MSTMAELSHEGHMRETIRGYLDALGRNYEWCELSETFLIDHKVGDQQVEIAIRWNQHFLSMVVNGLVVAPKRGKIGVLESAMSLHWETLLPKLEWDPRDGEIRAAWYLPVEDGPPTFEQFRQTLDVFQDAVLRVRPQLEEAIAKAKRGLGATPEDRVPEAAELENLGRDLVDLASRREILPMYVREELVEKVVAALSGP
ncbi:MAG: YbjN domain-containing protein, partial [Armatimonadetes bacterium]|nr:YbjN domain-containing protein [Armatimonadota bacterium]